jgi:hypothetical protein
VVSDLVGRSSSAPPPEPERTVATNFVRVGDCLENAPGGPTLTSTSCDKPHYAEVYGILSMPFDAFPGDATVKEYKAKCPQLARTYVTPEEGMDPSLRTNISFPDQSSWNQGLRSVVCFIVFDQPRTGAFGAGKWLTER